MFEISKGMIVKSLAGHDKDHLYVVMEYKDGCVYLVDGKGRTINKSKKKKRKHIQPVHYIDNTVSQEKEKITDCQIRNALVKYTKQVNEEI